MTSSMQAVTGRVIRWLADIGKKDPEAYKVSCLFFGMCCEQLTACYRLFSQSLGITLRKEL